MNRRSAKAPYSPAELSAHLARHLHLAHNLHVKNHVHMHRKDMLNPRQLPLRRELTAMRKVKSLQDPSTSSHSFSPVSASCNSHACRASNAHMERMHRRGREKAVEVVDRNHTYRKSGHGEEYVPRSDLFSRGERWQGDAAEIARRLIADRRTSSPSALSLLDDFTTSDSCEDEEEAGLVMASEHLSNSAGSPLLTRGHRNRRRWKVDTTAASRCRRAAEELEISCGMPHWSYKPTSSANKYKSKSLLNHACTIPEPKKSETDPEQAPRHGSQPPAPEAAASLKVNQCEDAPRVRNSSLSYKYRPRSFKDVVGQTLVVRSLSTAITKGRLSQLYLFAGPRGSGKTTLARVFAAALVCLNVEPHRRPCGLCRECATLTLNRSRNVRETDVAGIPDSLLSLSHQVFIVKGCESLGVELWTRLLDEQLPKNAVFILIATDLERLPLSATSRCQKFLFGKLKEAEILRRLRFLADKEKLNVEGAALALIASRAEGSVRDAESTLDQLSLLDQTITLSMVQELSGLIPDKKLVELLDTALAADMVNTVKMMRALLDAGVDALSLVAQMASLITNILAGTFELQREQLGFFHRNLPRKEEQQRLRQALKVLAECEKQLRVVSSDRATWLTAALLQFAPDKSYLPSSVDTSPIAFDTLERLDDEQPCTPRLPPPQPYARKHARKSSSNTSVQGQKDKEKAGLDKVSSPVLRGGNRDFKVLSLREMEHVWDKVLDGCRSNVLRQLLSSHGALTALSITSDETFAVAHVEFRTSEHKARAERLRSSTCHAFQMALGCPVELKLSLQRCSPSSSGVKLAPADDSPVFPHVQTRSSSRHEMLTGLAARSRRLADTGSGPRLSSAGDYKYCFPAAHGSSCRYRSGRRPPFTRANSLDAPVVKVRRKNPTFKGITSKKRKLKPRRKRTGVAGFCWQSPLSELEQPKNIRKVGIFLRLVPCGRSTDT